MLATANTGENRERFWEKNAGEWTGSVELSKEEIPGSKRSVYSYILSYSDVGQIGKTAFLAAWRVMRGSIPAYSRLSRDHL